MNAFVLLASASLAIQSTQTIQLESPVLVTQDLQVHDLTDQIPAGTQARLRAEVALVSNRVDTTTGHYLLPALTAYWQIKSESGIELKTTPNSTHSWYGWMFERDPLEVLSFNENTGSTRVRLVIPIGMLTNGFEYPLIPGGGSTINVLVGWQDVMTANMTSAPTGYDWQGSLSLDAAVPAVWTYITKTVVQHASSVPVIIRLDALSASPRTFQVEATTSGLLVDSYTVTIPADEADAFFYVQTKSGAIGTLRLRVLEDGQIVSHSNESNVSVGGLLTLADPTNGSMEPFVPPEPPPLYKTCVPPSASVGGPTVVSFCGPCTTGSPSANCPNTPGGNMYVRIGGCKQSWSGACVITGQVTVTGDTFDYIGFDIVECGSFSGGLSGLWGAITGTKTINKACCKYQYNGGTSSAALPNCQ